jgi:hypothetical protein
LTLDPRPPALRGERRYLVKQRKRAVCRRVCAVQLFNEDLDHLGAPPCFCLLSRDLSPPFFTTSPGNTPGEYLYLIIPLLASRSALRGPRSQVSRDAALGLAFGDSLSFVVEMPAAGDGEFDLDDPPAEV